MSDANDFLKNQGKSDGRGGLSLDRPTTGGNEPPSEPEVREDAGTQAMSEALRSSFAIIKVIMVILVLVFLGSGVFTVPSQERAIKLRFGKPVGSGESMLLEPGLHFGLPYPIDEIVRIPTGQMTVRSSVGWYAISPEQEAAGEEPAFGQSLNPALDGYTLSSDANIMHVRVRMNYRVTDALQYALGHVNASNLVQNALNNAIVFASSRTTVDNAFRLDRDGFRETVSRRARELVQKQNLGITIDLTSVEVVPPLSLKAKFEEVTSADSTRRETEEKARGEAGHIVNDARREADRTANTASSDSKKLVAAVRAESGAFLAQLPRFQSDPWLFMERLKADALRHALTNVQEVHYLQPGGELRVLLNRAQLLPKAQPPKP